MHFEHFKIFVTKFALKFTEFQIFQPSARPSAFSCIDLQQPKAKPQVRNLRPSVDHCRQYNAAESCHLHPKAASMAFSVLVVAFGSLHSKHVLWRCPGMKAFILEKGCQGMAIRHGQARPSFKYAPRMAWSALHKTTRSRTSTVGTCMLRSS